ncbi:unnamed protein product [Calypogeia fissa]
MVVRSELNLDPKSLKQEQAKVWKKHPALIKPKLLLPAQLMREVDSIPSNLKADFSLVMKLTPWLLEELMKMAVIPRNAEGHGWLRPALGVMELSQSIILFSKILSRNWISESLICFGYVVNEILIRFRIRIFVRTVHDRQLPVRLLDISISGSGFQTQDQKGVKWLTLFRAELDPIKHSIELSLFS